MQNGVFDAANVLVDGEPVADDLAVEWSFFIARISVAIEVPGRIHKRIHGIGLATCGTATVGAGRVEKFGHARQR